jgi:hypothetical protein
MTTKVSPYVKFAIAYCNKQGLFTTDELTGKRDYQPEDLWEGILVMRDWELRNRGNNSKKAKV